MDCMSCNHGVNEATRSKFWIFPGEYWIKCTENEAVNNKLWIINCLKWKLNGGQWWIIIPTRKQTGKKWLTEGRYDDGTKWYQSVWSYCWFFQCYLRFFINASFISFCTGRENVNWSKLCNAILPANGVETHKFRKNVCVCVLCMYIRQSFDMKISHIMYTYFAILNTLQKVINASKRTFPPLSPTNVVCLVLMNYSWYSTHCSLSYSAKLNALNSDTRRGEPSQQVLPFIENR